ncbi:hypothetical protein [Pseudovibrio exalbescens]|uniref:hypothetical protein n=1 Tax=Pseudovibrio exalbescens TaxID=197461 RepID=UPI0011AF4217|nr:hypothetical protein [Pseudovibrio exalbescens]
MARLSPVSTRYAAGALCGLMVLAGSAQAREIKSERLSFEAGASSGTVSGEISGYETTDYLVNVRAGQVMKATLQTPHRATYFNVIPPSQEDVATFIGSISGDTYEGFLAESGDYNLRVYMMRSAARRGETAPYTLDVRIDDPKPLNHLAQTTVPTPPPYDAYVPNTLFHATGILRCRLGNTTKTDACPFGVIRRGGGTATVVVTKPDLKTRGLYFENGEFTRGDAFDPINDGEEQSAVRNGDETTVRLGLDQFFVPDVVLYGG